MDLFKDLCSHADYFGGNKQAFLSPPGGRAVSDKFFQLQSTSCLDARSHTCCSAVWVDFSPSDEGRKGGGGEWSSVSESQGRALARGQVAGCTAPSPPAPGCCGQSILALLPPPCPCPFVPALLPAAWWLRELTQLKSDPIFQ